MINKTVDLVLSLSVIILAACSALLMLGYTIHVAINALT